MAEGTEHLLKDREMPNLYSPSEDELSSRGETGSSSKPQLNRKAVVVFFGVIIVAAAIIVCTVMISIYSGKEGSFSSRFSRSASKKFKFEDIFSGKFSPGAYSAHWVSDTEYVTTKRDVGVIIRDVASNTSRTLLDAKKQGDLGMNDHWFSPNRKYLLFTKNRHQQYRYSFLADYFIYNLETGEGPTQIEPESTQSEKGLYKIQYAAWSNNKSSLVIVYRNDIYYMASPTSQIRRLTDNGIEHTIFNGIPDWVYQEEVLNSDHAVWFSPDDRYLAFFQFNDTGVPWYRFPWYGNRRNSYTEIKKIAYPKPGYPNPTVKVFSIDLLGLNSQDSQAPAQKTEFVEPPDFQHSDHYAVNFGWGTDQVAAVTWLNRNQDNSILALCNAASGVCKESFNLKVSGGWVDDKFSSPLFSRDGQYYITVLPFLASDKTGADAGKFLHLGKISTGQSTNAEPLTSGTWEVTKILAHDDVGQIVYFTASKESPTKLHIYSVSVKTKDLKCLTCAQQTVISKNSCSYYDAQFSLKGSWYILYCKGPGIPEITLRSTKTDTVEILEDNKDLRKRLKDVHLPTSQIYTVPSGDNVIYVKEYLPPDFDDKRQYAVLFSVYGGPNSQKVVEAYGYGFETGYLASNFDIIVVELDARGTCCRGESFKHQVYKHLGKYEAEDTIRVAEYLMANKKYVDKTKFAIWGWSYGGFLTSYVLGKSSVFKVGMAVAPVTDWRYYDSIYTERYMLQPKDNLDGYEESSVLPLVKNFKNDSFLLVHGTGDDNVHFQNTAQLVSALTKEGVKYRVQFYTDRNHGLVGGGTTDHVYHLLTQFLVEKLAIIS